MRFKHTLQSLALSLSLSLGLAFFSLPVRAQTGTPILVNGTNYAPTSGTTIATTANGSTSNAVRVYNGGTLFGANGWTLSTSGSAAYGVVATGTSSFSGTNLNISTTGSSPAGGVGAYGVYVLIRSAATLTTSTIATEGAQATGILATNTSSIIASDLSVSTTGYGAHGIRVESASSFSGTNINVNVTGLNTQALVNLSGTISITGGTLRAASATSPGSIFVGSNATTTLSNVTVNMAGDLVGSTAGYGGTNTVVLENVRGTNGANMLNLSNTTAATTNLTIQNSTLKGTLTTSNLSTGNVNLVSGTLTGAANKVGASSALNVTVDSASKWIVNASSTMNALTNQGVVDMSTGGALRNLSVSDFTQAAGASIAMTLAGNGGVANELVNMNGQLTLAGALILNGNAGAAAASSVEGGSFVLFAGATSVSGAFTDIQLNGASYGAIADGASFTDAAGYTYTLSYHGDATTGSLTGGNDVLLHVIPEPGAWAMLASGLGLLAAGQRLRRRSRG